MSIAPVGIIHAGCPAQDYQDAFVLSGMLQDGLECEVVATAAAVAAALLPKSTVDTVLQTMRRHSTDQVRRLIIRALHLAESSHAVNSQDSTSREPEPE